MPIFDDEYIEAVETDKWDSQDYDDAFFDVQNLQRDVKELHKNYDFVPDAYSDLFMLLYQGDPMVRDKKKMDQSRLFNHAIASKFQTLEEIDELRTSTKFDPYTSAFALVSMKEAIKNLYEKEQNIQDQIEQLIEMAKAMQEKWDKMSNEEKAAAQAAYDANKEAIEEYLEGMDPQLQEALKEANRKIQEDEGLVRSFGVEDGELRRMSYQERRNLMEKLKTSRMMKFSKLLGQFKMVAKANRRRKANDQPDETVGVETGADLTKLVPSELMYLAMPEFEDKFWIDFVNRELVQFRQNGKESLGSGPVLIICDESGSMSASCGKGGTREMWSKAFTLALLDQCRKNKRDFTYIGFSSGRQIYEASFPGGKGPIAKVIELTEHFFAGGPLRIDQKVATPDGWREIGKLAVGDQVYAVDGTAVNVLGVYPQGELDMYEMTFDDGETIICDKSHRFMVHESSTRKWSVRTVENMIQMGVRYEHKEGGWNRFRVPVAKPIQGTYRDLPLDPYLLGYILGDGSTMSKVASISSSEDEFPWEQYLPAGVSKVQTEKREGFCPVYHLSSGGNRSRKNPLTEILRGLGLWKVHGRDKFIPEEYMWSDVEQRWALLQGLLDSDGSVSNCSTAEFSSCSFTLCKNVAQLVESLGGVAKISERQPHGKGRNVYYRVACKFNADSPIPFRLSRKVESWKNNYRSNSVVRSIVSIEPIESAEAVCIYIDHESHLFLTEGFIPTHNTEPIGACKRAAEIVKSYPAAKRPDIVIISDGYFYINDEEFKKDWAKVKSDTSMQVFGVTIDSAPAELIVLCDTIVEVTNLTADANRMADVFKAIGS